MKLCLASSSPRRSQLLESAGLNFFVCDPGVDEIVEGELPPTVLAGTNARLKAKTVALLHPDAVVVAADTVVWLEGQTFGKPSDMDAAHHMLEKLGGKWHEVFTAVCIHPPVQSGTQPVEFVECTRVALRSFSHAQRTEYFAKINPLDKAGAYAAQEASTNLVEAIEGSFSNVVGLPMEALCSSLKQSFPRLFS